MNLSRPSNLEMVMNDTVMNQAEEAASIEQSAWCPNGAETNTRVQNHAMEIQHFHVTNQPRESNFLHTHSNQAGQMNPLLSASTGLMHHLLNNSLRLPSEARMSSSQPYMSQLNGYHAPDNTDGAGLLNHHHATEPLVNETCPIETQIVQSLLSQPNQIDEQMSFQSNQRQTQTHGSQRTPAAIRSKRNRDKNKEMIDTLKNEKEKATENERGLTEENEKLTAEKTMLMNEIGKLKAEKMEWKKEKQVLTANMTANTESIRKLAAQYEALSQSKQWIKDLEGFQHSNEQILKQNRRSNIKRRIVLQLDVSDGKDKQKAMEVVSVLSGIDSISIDMKDKKLTVIGDVDPINVVSKLRNQWYTEILTVVPVKEEEKKDTKKDEKKKESDQIAELVKAYRAYNPYTTMHYHPVRALENPNSCVIC